MTKYALLLTAIAATACTASTAAPGRSDNEPLGTIRWTVDALGTERKDGRVQVSFETGDGNRNRSQWSSGYPLAELQGLGAAQLAGSSQPVRFALVREPGRLDCTGTAGNGQGIGTCSFAANPAFAGRLAAAGIGQPTQREAYSLTLGNVRGELLDELGRHGYEHPSIGDLVAMSVHRVTPAYVREIADAGYRLGRADALVQFRIFGIDGDFIRGMAAVGPQFRSLDAKDLVQFKIFKVKPELVRAYAQLGYPSLDAKDLVTMSIHGVTPEFITELAALGYRGIPARKLVDMRIHGVTPAYVRSLRADGITPPAPEQLVRLRMSGYQPGKR